MAQGNLNHQKTVKKSSHWAAHGKHPVDPGVLARERREKIRRPPLEMFGSVKEAFDAARKKRK